MGHGGNFPRILRPERHQRFGAVPLQPWLVGHQKQHPVTVRQPFQPQTDAAAQPQIGPVIGYGGKAVFPGQRQNVRILAYDHGDKTTGNGFQRPADERFSVHLRLQLVGAEPAGVSRRQHHASDFQCNHP